MATLEREFSARWGVDEVFRYFRDGILAGSQAVTDGACCWPTWGTAGFGSQGSPPAAAGWRSYGPMARRPF